MSIPAALPPAPDPADESKWGYRQSLASRVVLLTMFAVGISVAVMAAGAYVVVRMQLQSSLDESLVRRAEDAARGQVLVQITKDYDIPSWALGAGDVRIAFVREDGVTRFLDQGDVVRLSDSEVSVAAGEQEQSLRASPWSSRSRSNRSTRRCGAWVWSAS
jgi:two-component system sensor histidine kinase MprB